MKKSLFSVLLASIVLLGGGQAVAQNVIFPGQVQPGTAQLAATEGVYTLSNDLLSVSFIEEGETLKFGGCEQLNLLPGTELFTLNLADGSIIPSSAMKLTGVSTETLAANPKAFKGSEKFAGHAITASFESDKLNVEWRAVLRDGSHYFRTEMSITPTKGDVNMKGITAMLYDVKNVEGHQAPTVVGNTRGAIIANDLMFAGLETPMGKNSIQSATAGMEAFNPTAWTPESFCWEPGMETPPAILELHTIAGNQPLTAENIIGARGYVAFKRTGEQNLTFIYQSGNHRLDLVGVDACNPETGEVIASDYHAGFSGSQKQDHVYTLNIPETGIYILRYFVETRSETLTSSGKVEFSKPIGIPEIRFGEAPTEAPMRRVLSSTTTTTMSDGDTETDSWNGTNWINTGAANVPERIAEVGVTLTDVRHMERKIAFSEPANLTIEFVYSSGNHRLDICGVDLLDAEGNVVVNDYHSGFSGTNKVDNVYKMTVPYAGEFTLRYFSYNAANARNTNGNINISYSKPVYIYLPAQETQTIQGLWTRNTTLQEGNTWTVSAVVGLMAEGQQRRSVASYVDRERGAAWRSFPLYNSWFELNINRNNAPAPKYDGNMTSKQCVNVIRQWKKKLYEAYGANIQTFMWDDGWDEYGTWGFNPNFPNGFTDIDEAASSMNSSIGAWLGPVGGYGQSGNFRRQYWSDKGGMQLSNPDYYNVFLTQCSFMLNNYNFNFFKFDGISSIFSATGPDPNNEEGAEGIIDIEQKLRKIKPDVFFNTSVGTWASPFWYTITDCTWRQENDFGKTGNNNIDREQWITYRDRLVYQNYVTNSPLCPINSIMTHGLILTSKDHESRCAYSQEYEHVLREMRCAFVCGTSMVELYTDYALMNSIKGPDGKAGKLWEDMAECIFWHQNNADVLPDAHWVGGNPWTGSKHEVYGWASWNGEKATLALRNGANEAQTFKTTLRQALDIPAHITGTIRLKHSFKVQTALEGMPLNEPIDIDKELTLKLPASSLFCYDGVEGNSEWPVYPDPVLPGQEVSISEVDSTINTDTTIYDLQGRRVVKPSRPGLYIQSGKIIKL